MTLRRPRLQAHAARPLVGAHVAQVNARSAASTRTPMSCPFPSLENLDQLSDATKEKAARELNESDDTRQAKIDELRTKIEEFKDEEGLLVDSRRDDAFLLRFLRARKFDIDRAIQLYTNYFQFRKNHPEIFAEFNLEKVVPYLQTGTFSIGNRSRDG